MGIDVDAAPRQAGYLDDNSSVVGKEFFEGSVYAKLLIYA